MSKFLSFGRARNSDNGDNIDDPEPNGSPIPEVNEPNSPYTDFSQQVASPHGPAASGMLRRQRSYEQDPDERTRLLGPRSTYTRGPLDPDDPAVSPYNLWTVSYTTFLIVSFHL